MLELAASFTFDAGADTLSVQPLRAEAFGLRMSGAVAGRDVTRAATWTGTGNVAQFSPQELLQRFGLPPQATSDPQAFTRATVATRFAVTKDSAELDSLVLTLDETTLRGTFTLQGFDAPAYRFALNVDAVDADRYLPPKARDAQAGEATAGDIELPQNNTMNLDGTMQVGSLKLAGIQFADVGGRIVIGGGDLAVENARASLYGGTFAGNFRVHAAGDDPGLALDGSCGQYRARAAHRGADSQRAKLQRHGQLRPEPRRQRPHRHRKRANGRRQRQLRNGERRDQRLQLGPHVVRRVQRHATCPRATRAAGGDGI